MHTDPSLSELDNNLKRIKQSKCKELKDFAVHLAKRLDVAKKDLLELKSIIEKSHQKEFTTEFRLKKQIFESAAELYNNNPSKSRRIDSLKSVVAIFLQLYYSNEKEYKLLCAWAKELEINKSKYRHQGIIKDFQNYLDRIKDTSST